MKTQHDGDCTYFASPINGRTTDGICTCGYGLQIFRQGDGDDSHLVSEDRVAFERDNRLPDPLSLCGILKGGPSIDEIRGTECKHKNTRTSFAGGSEYDVWCVDCGKSIYD